MKTIFVDDELWSFDMFEAECENITEIEIIGKFDDPQDAYAFAKENRVDLAFLDVEMPEMNGMELSDKLQELHPGIIIIFVSAYDRHMRSAIMEHDADWFITKPYTEKQVVSAIERAKLLSARQRERVVIKTFGTFEVQVDGKPLKILPKAKELLALLVFYHGSSITPETAMERIWDNEHYSHDTASKYRNALANLIKALREADIEYIITRTTGTVALRCDLVSCDSFDLMKGEKEAVRAFLGDYMTNYAWAVDGVGMLIALKQKYDPAAGDELYDL